MKKILIHLREREFNDFTGEIRRREFNDYEKVEIVDACI